ncbi:MAG: low molecular weight phosphotyrosine protein phosphatase [Clostridia bacterium]|nr:low molecular weight phosphotyrosine protein phosphatase [Clostridia bacterium]
MTKLMFVCHGNICRSPMAEFVFKDLAAKRGLSDRFIVASSATSTEEIWNGIGNPVDRRAAATLRQHGVPFDGHRAVQLQKRDYEKYDLFLVMDENNRRNTLRIFGDDPDEKVKKLLGFAGGGSVADPWYSGDFEAAFDDILRGCEALLETMEN